MRRMIIAATAAVVIAAGFGSATASTPGHPHASVTAGGKTFTVAPGRSRHAVRTLQSTYYLNCIMGVQAWFQAGPAPLIGSIQGRTAITCTGGPVSRISMTACITRDNSPTDCIGGTSYGNTSYAIPIVHQCDYTTYGYTWHATAAATVWNIFGGSGGSGNTSPPVYTNRCH